VRTWVPSLLTAAGALAVLGFFGAIAKGVQAWRTPHTVCIRSGYPGAEGYCTMTAPVTGLAKVPWGYVGLSVGLFLLAVCIFTLRERMQAEDSQPES